MFVTVFVKRHRGVPIRPGALDNPKGRLWLVDGNPPYAELQEPNPPKGQEPKLLLPRLYKYEVTLKKRVLIVRGLERVGDAVHYQEWRCNIDLRQHDADWP